MSDLPHPLWSSDVNLGCFADLEIPARWIGGREFAGMSDRARWALLRCLKVAWHERPAGSLPADQFALCEIAGLGDQLEAWAEIEADVLRDWILCADERFYFRPWEETILAAWDRRTRRRSTAQQSQARRRLVDMLQEAGVNDAARIPRRRLEDVLEAWVERGGPELRGETRRRAAVQLASDCGLLPGDEMRAGQVADVRAHLSLKSFKN
ncbi:MAG: hypothetical protein AAGD13_00670 [Pseudomonadota bacterium]